MELRQRENLTKRRKWFEGTAIAVPTLAHVPGVQIEGRYMTKLLRMRQGGPHAALKKPRQMFKSQPRLVHLGKGKVMFE